MYVVLAITMDLAHLAAMLIWVIGLPMLFWHRWPRLSLIYMWFALAFVVASQLSQWVLGECFLTTLSRELWEAAGDPTVGSFTARLVNAVAGFRPSERSVVLIWEISIAVTSLGMLWALWRRNVRSVKSPVQ